MKGRARYFNAKAASVGVVLLSVAVAVARADSAPSMPNAPLCGVYTLYTALRAEGVEVRFSDLLRQRYIGSASGSTLQELLDAARQNHAHAQLLDNLSVRDLHHLGCPAILHVKNEYDSRQYNHYVLCVPMADGGLGLYDPPDPLVRTAGDELAPIWDGTALAVSAKPISLKSMRLWACVRIGLIVLAGLLLAPAARLVQFRMIRRWCWHGWSGPCIQCSLLLSLSAAVAGAYHWASPQGFRARHEAVAAICNSYFVSPPGDLDWSEARTLWQAHNACFVDARIPEDYQRGHIAGAINVPPSATRSDRAMALSRLPKDMPLVVYCLNPSCPLAGLLAKRLARDGFVDVKVFSGGWSEWSSHERSEDAQGQLLNSNGSE